MIRSRLTQYPLGSAQATAEKMTDLVKKYSKDIGDKAKWPLPKFYAFVRALPFRSDPPGHESIARAKFTINPEWPWRDCDDKAIILGCWCYENGVPFRFRASSKAKDGQLHHVYVMCKFKGKLLPLDATYPRNKLFIEESGLTKKLDLTGDIMNPTLNVFDGDARIVNTELLGSSLLTKVKRLGTQTKKATIKAGKIALKTPGLKEAVASAIPGGTAALEKMRAAAKKAKAAKEKLKVPSYNAATSETTVPVVGSIPKKYLIGGGLAALALIVLATRKTKAS